MKKFLSWLKKNQDVVLRMVYSIPVILAVIVSINHAITWFDISNPNYWSVFLSISVEIVALTTLVALILGKNTFSVVTTFIIITLVQILGNIFFSFNFIDESGNLFQSWVKFVDIIFTDSELTMDKHKFWLATIQGSVVPLLSLLSIHLIYSLKLKEDKDTKKLSEEIKPIQIQKEVEVIPEKVFKKPTNFEPIEEDFNEIEEYLPDFPIIDEPNIDEEEIPEILEEVTMPVINEQVEPIKRVKIPKRIHKPDVVEISNGEFVPIKEDETKSDVEEIIVQDEEPEQLYYEDMGQPASRVINKQKRQSFLPRVKINNRK